MKTSGWRAGDTVALVAPLAVGLLGSLPTARAIPSWYRTLNKPRWNPPDAVFAPVWTTLYGLMGIALVLVRRRGGEVGEAERVFGVQLALNLAWSLVFFGRRDPRAALAVMGLLWLAIVATIAEFWRLRPAASLLLAPYLAWVSFAALLNAEIARRNPTGG
ncbi:MAG TPA: TspO/MBR family protein [Candidatus Limnocylindrales bacterium]|nr:TspO/MBR family protein [Candidatus Limnocylindrales bacterium]